MSYNTLALQMLADFATFGPREDELCPPAPCCYAKLTQTCLDANVLINRHLNIKLKLSLFEGVYEQREHFDWVSVPRHGLCCFGLFLFT